MDPGLLDTLTDRECDALRLVLTHDTAKRIAIALGGDITPSAVNERLRSARRKLGVLRSRDAARLLAQREGLPYNRVVDDAAQVVDAAVVPKIAASNNDVEREAGSGTDILIKEEQTAFGTFPPPAPRTSLKLPLRQGKPTNDLTPWERLGWIAAIALIAAASSAIAAVFFFGLYLAGVGATGKLGALLT